MALRHDRRMTSIGALDPDAGAELLRLLGPLAHEVEAAVRHPPTVAAGDWSGPASRACEELEGELRGRLGAVLAELDVALDAARRSL